MQSPDITFIQQNIDCPQGLAGKVRVASSRNHAIAQKATWILYFLDGRLTVENVQDPSLSPLCVDFGNNVLSHRMRNFSASNEMLCKAVVGKSKPQGLQVLDATAGLGRDSFLLASAGCHVTLYERSPIAHALLDDGLSRMRADAGFPELSMELYFHDILNHSNKLSLVSNGANESDHSNGKKWDVVYLDPMFPERKKTALVKQEMRIFKGLVGVDDDSSGLLVRALQMAAKKVVVKRPKLASPLNNQTPSHQYTGKTGRFDVYVVA